MVKVKLDLLVLGNYLNIDRRKEIIRSFEEVRNIQLMENIQNTPLCILKLHVICQKLKVRLNTFGRKSKYISILGVTARGSNYRKDFAYGVKSTMSVGSTFSEDSQNNSQMYHNKYAPITR